MSVTATAIQRGGRRGAASASGALPAGAASTSASNPRSRSSRNAAYRSASTSPRSRSLSSAVSRSRYSATFASREASPGGASRPAARPRSNGGTTSSSAAAASIEARSQNRSIGSRRGGRFAPGAPGGRESIGHTVCRTVMPDSTGIRCRRGIRCPFIYTLPLAGSRGHPWRAGTSREGVPGLPGGTPARRMRVILFCRKTFPGGAPVPAGCAVPGGAGVRGGSRRAGPGCGTPASTGAPPAGASFREDARRLG